MKTAKPPATAAPEALASRRSQPVRQTRTNPPRASTTAGYSLGRDGGSGNGSSGNGSGSGGHEQPIDIFPGVVHFTDAITALPKELVKHFTLLKEVDAKIHVPQQALFQLVDDALRMPSPNATRSPYDGTSLVGTAPTSAPMTAQTSASGTGPLVNGQMQPQTQTQTQTQDQAQSQGHPLPSSDDAVNSGVFDRSNLPRRQLFRQVAFEIKEMLVALEEKNHVISTANDALNKQLARIDDIWPHLEQEFSEEAKWGSNNHWAYPENRAAHRANNHAQTERSRREGAANLSAAAQQIADEAAARSDARKQAVAARRSQKNNHHQESDADSHPHKNDTKKTGGSKSRKPLPEANAAAGVGLGISGATAGVGANGTASSSSKRRKVEKPAASSTPMERALSGVLGSAAGNTRTRTASPRQSPAPDGTKKRKAVPAVGNQAKKTRNGTSAASSPVIGAFPDPKTGQGSPALANHNFRSPVLRTTSRFDDIAIATGGSIASVLEAANHAQNNAVGDVVNGSHANEGTDAKTGANVLHPDSTIGIKIEAPKAGHSGAVAGGNNETGTATTNGSATADKDEAEHGPSAPPAASLAPPSAAAPGPAQSSAQSAAENSRHVPAPLALSSEVQMNSGSLSTAQAKEAPVPAAAAGGAQSTAERANADKEAKGAASAPAPSSETLKAEAADSPAASSAVSAKADEAAAAMATAAATATTTATATAKKELTPLSAASAPAATPAVATSQAQPTVTTTKSGRASKPSTPSLGTFSDVPSRSRRPSRSAETGGNGSGANSNNGGSNSGSNSTSSAGSGTTKRSHKKGASISSQAHAQAAAQAAAAASNGGLGDAANGNGYNSSGSGGSGGSSTRHQQQQQQRQHQHQDEDESDPLYCYCQQISFGEMIACDAEDCAREWFHLECVGLRVAPKANVKWYCDDCKKRLKVGERKSNGR